MPVAQNPRSWWRSTPSGSASGASTATRRRTARRASAGGTAAGDARLGFSVCGWIRLGLHHVEVETELDQRDLMLIGRMRTHRERQPMAIQNHQDLHAFAPAGGTDALAAAIGRGKRRINAALPLVDRLFDTQRIVELRENLAQYLAFAPLLNRRCTVI